MPRVGGLYGLYRMWPGLPSLPVSGQSPHTRAVVSGPPYRFANRLISLASACCFAHAARQRSKRNAGFSYTVRVIACIRVACLAVS